MLTEPTPADPIAWLNYGVLGLVVVSLIFGWLWARPAVDRALKQVSEERDRVLAQVSDERDRALAERDRALAQRDDISKMFEERVLPMINDFIGTTAALLPVLQRYGQQPRRGGGRDGARD